MCRFLVYRGSDEVLLSKLILDPAHSILKQSFDSRLRLDTRRGQNNADGFGIGFYTDPKLGHEPCLFTSIVPAWNDTNLHRMASKTASRLVFAHVRATTEGSLSQDNCHPFTCGRLMWMHNGGLGGWKHIKRRLGERLHDRWYNFVTGGTDSEWAFALFLDRLERLGVDPNNPPPRGFGPTVLRRAMLQTIGIINDLTTAIPESVVQAEGVDTRSLLNFAVTDGQSIICTRYVSSRTDEAASLYYSSGIQWATNKNGPDARKSQAGNDSSNGNSSSITNAVLVASEPLNFERENWVDVPTNSILTIHHQSVMVHPIIDGFSARDPYHKRSSVFAATKGLTTNEKSAPRVIADSVPLTPNPDPEAPKTVLGPLATLHHLRSKSSDRPPRIQSILAQTENLSYSNPLDGVFSPPTNPSVSDIRILTPLTERQSDAKPPLNQGNIKKKRRSLMTGEWSHPAEFFNADTEPLPQPPDSPPSRASEYGNSEKAARILGLQL